MPTFQECEGSYTYSFVGVRCPNSLNNRHKSPFFFQAIIFIEIRWPPNTLNLVNIKI
jgi:hypothetical protein